MNKLRNFMLGRYGVDKLNFVLLICSILISAIASILNFEIGLFLSYIPLIWCFYRTFSRNIYKRANENQVFLSKYGPLEQKAIASIKLLIGTKTHKYYKCSKCKQTIRVPRGKGKICISCPKCRNEFIKNT